MGVIYMDAKTAKLLHLKAWNTAVRAFKSWQSCPAIVEYCFVLAKMEDTAYFWQDRIIDGIRPVSPYKAAKGE